MEKIPPRTEKSRLDTEVPENPFAAALARLREEDNREEKPETTENQTNFEKGEVIRGVRFVNDNGRFISSGAADNRKAFLLDLGEYKRRNDIDEDEDFDLDTSGSFAVRVARDTKPGQSSGFVVVELIGRDEFVNEAGERKSPAEQELQAEMSELNDAKSALPVWIGADFDTQKKY